MICGLALLWTRAAAARDYGSHEGYLDDTTGERHLIVEEMVIIQPPAQVGPTLSQKIFNDQLTREFREKYEDRFGRTEAEQVYYSPNRFTYFNDVYGYKGSPQEVSNERRKFGEYMLRRLSEWHIDNYAKNDPAARPVWEAKERLSQVKVEAGGIKFNAKYSISGNHLDLKANHRWLDSKVTLELGGPRGVEETIITLSRGITPTIAAESHWKTTDGIVSVVGKKRLSPSLGTSLSASTYTNHTGKSVRESLYLAGVTYVF